MGGKRKLTGIVYSDLGRAASFIEIAWVAQTLEQALGFRPFPGTLNIKLDTPEAEGVWRAAQRADGILITAPDESFCNARCFHVRIEGNWPGAAILPAIDGYPASKLEVIAPVRLKDALDIEDGARVTIEFVD
jgi:riboflavin kinase, archaea type